jgi:methyltransferase (TIGR00027 family)
MSESLTGVHRTAIGAATLRAFHLLREGEPKILRDEFALSLSGFSEQEVVARSAEYPHTSAAWVLRSRYAEDRLAAARVRLNQYVVLGAGLDSYALRHAADLDELMVFEVDDPAMQGWKQARFRHWGWRSQESFDLRRVISNVARSLTPWRMRVSRQERPRSSHG